MLRANLRLTNFVARGGKFCERFEETRSLTFGLQPEFNT